MAGTVNILNMGIVRGLLVLVGDGKTNGRTGGFPLENTRKELHLVWFLSLGNDGRLPRTTAVELTLDGLDADRQTGRATFNDAAYGRAVRFAECGKLEKCPEGVSGHVWGFDKCKV